MAEKTKIIGKLNMTYQLLQELNMDYDACGEYGTESVSCSKVKENWREMLLSHTDLIHTIAEIYAEFHGDDDKLREVLKAQVELLLATWLKRVAKLSADVASKLEEMISDAYSVLYQHGVLLDVPCNLEELESRIFAFWTSVLHTLSVSVHGGAEGINREVGKTVC